MGFKRPFDDEEFQELPYKHSRQLDINNKVRMGVAFINISGMMHLKMTLSLTN